MNKQSLFFYVIVVVFTIVLAAVFHAVYSGNNEWSRLGAFGLSGELIDRFPLSSSGNMFKGEDGNGAILRITRTSTLSREESSIFMQDKVAALSFFSEEIVSPYPGEISSSIRCDESFKPREYRVAGKEYYSLYASSRLGYGVCSIDLAAYRSFLAFFYCNSSSELYQVEVFVPLSINEVTYEQGISSIRCR